MNFWWLHPVTILLVPIIAISAFGISFQVVYYLFERMPIDWAKLISGSVWLSVFTAGILGGAFHLVSSWRIASVVPIPYPARMLRGINDMEYMKLNKWLKSGLVTAESMKSLLGGK